MKKLLISIAILRWDCKPETYVNSSLTHPWSFRFGGVSRTLFGGIVVTDTRTREQEMEDVNFQEEDMDEDAGEDEDDVEMDFGDETGSEDTSETDEDAEDDIAEDIENESGEAEGDWQDEDEDEDEEGLIENDEEDAEGGEEEDDDDDEGEEVMWQVCHMSHIECVLVVDTVVRTSLSKKMSVRMVPMTVRRKRKEVVRCSSPYSHTGADGPVDAIPIMHMDMDEEADVASEEE